MLYFFAIFILWSLQIRWLYHSFLRPFFHISSTIKCTTENAAWRGKWSREWEDSREKGNWGGITNIKDILKFHKDVQQNYTICRIMIHPDITGYQTRTQCQLWVILFKISVHEYYWTLKQYKFFPLILIIPEHDDMAPLLKMSYTCVRKQEKKSSTMHWHGSFMPTGCLEQYQKFLCMLLGEKSYGWSYPDVYQVNNNNNWPVKNMPISTIVASMFGSNKLHSEWDHGQLCRTNSCLA